MSVKSGLPLIKGRAHSKDLQSIVPRRLFGLEREEVTGTCKKLHNGELDTSH
jgi:hypothetical protein